MSMVALITFKWIDVSLTYIDYANEHDHATRTDARCNFLVYVL